MRLLATVDVVREADRRLPLVQFLVGAHAARPRLSRGDTTRQSKRGRRVTTRASIYNRVLHVIPY